MSNELRTAVEPAVADIVGPVPRAAAVAPVSEDSRVAVEVRQLVEHGDMEAARELYSELGFEEIPPYYHNPIPGAHYLRAQL